MPAKKKKKAVKKKIQKINFWGNIFEFIKGIVDTILNKFKKTDDKKILKAGAIVLVVVFLLLGLSLRWSCGKDGFNCSGGYTPPDPDDVKKVIPLVGDKAPASDKSKDKNKK